MLPDSIAWFAAILIESCLIAVALGVVTGLVCGGVLTRNSRASTAIDAVVSIGTFAACWLFIVLAVALNGRHMGPVLDRLTEYAPVVAMVGPVATVTVTHIIRALHRATNDTTWQN
jgi:hypothetical protein